MQADALVMSVDENEVPGAVETLTGLAAWLPRRVLLAIDLMLDVAFNGSAGPLSA